MKLVFTLLFSFFISGLYAQVTSTFDSDDEGWTAAYTDGTAATFEYLSTGGNPGGHLSASPPTAGGSVNLSFAWYWVAPEKFLGKNDFTYGKTISFDLKQSTEGTNNTFADIIIRNGSQSIHYRFPEKPGTDWTSYSIPLDLSADWRSNSAGGNVAYEHQIRAVLANITSIQIRCKWINVAGYSSQLDNVVLEQTMLETAPTITSFTPGTALAGETITINGSDFGTSPGTNRVFFGTKEATITSANSTQIQVIVPDAALFAPVRVLNTETGLSAQSSTFFQPQFNNQDEINGRLTASTFGPSVHVPYDENVLASVMGDIDGDGWLDVATLETGATIGIFRNSGLGGEVDQSTFDPRLVIPSGEIGQGNSGGLMLVDFDNDGKLDLVTYSRGRFDGFSNSGGIAVSRNISTPGNIAFEPARRFFELNIFFNGIAVADLDGDGRQDILINSSGLRVFQNTSTPGNIQFGVARSIHGTSGYVAVSDLNGDGKPEVIAFGPGNTNIVYENESTPGNIVITPVFSFPGNLLSGVTSADIDGDGKQDLIFYRGNSINNYDLVIRKNIHNAGPITEASLAPELIISKINGATSQRVIDINGDSRPEILMMGSVTSMVVFENISINGELNEDSFLPEIYFPANIRLNSPQIGDLNGDGKPDVVAFGSGGGGRGLVIYQNESVPKPTISLNTVSPLAGPAGSIVNITGEKFSNTPEHNTVWFGAVKANVLTATNTELTVEVPEGATYAPVGVTRDQLTSNYHLPFSTTFSAGVDFDNSHFAPPVNIALAGADYDIEVGDMNNDGLPDLLVEISNAARIFRNTYSTGEITADALTLDVSITGSFLNPKLQDIDGNGLLDIASVNGILRKNVSTGSAIEIDANVSFGGGGSNLIFADFNQDGKMDMAHPSNGGAQLIIKENRSRKGPFTAGTFPSFSPNIVLAKPSIGGGVATGDFDNDGFPDIVTTNPASGSISIYHNQQQLRLSPTQFIRTDIPVGVNPGRIYTGDFDNDGRLDLLLYHGTGANNTLLILFHNQSTPGNISFNRIDLTNPSATTVAHIADVDGDGRVDILTTSESGNRFSIFKNIHNTGVLSAASFAEPFNTTVTAPRGIATADLNLDGKPDIILTRNGFLAIYENLIPSFSTITIGDQPPDFQEACSGEIIQISISAGGTTNLTYQWQKQEGGDFVDLIDNTVYSNTATSTLMINTTGGVGSGIYRCRVGGDNADPVISQESDLEVTVVNPPQPVGGQSQTAPCGEFVVTLQVSGASGDQIYQWYEGLTGGEPIAGVFGGSYTTPELSQSQTYYVAILDPNDCESARIAIEAVIPEPPDINLTLDGNRLIAASGAATYQWFQNGQMIPGANSNFLDLFEYGVYFVRITTVTGCVSDSETIEFYVTEARLDALNGFQIYPNPGRGNFQITWPPVSASVKLRLFDMQGRQIKEKTLTGAGYAGLWNLEELQSGVYYLWLEIPEAKVVKRIMITK